MNTKIAGKLFLALVAACVLASPSGAAPLGQAAASFDDAHPDKAETAWGRLTADALRKAAKSDIALVSAATLRKGALPSGPVSEAGISALVAFPDDEVVVIQVTGVQLRAALERAVQTYPAGSPAMLQLSGLTAAFKAGAPLNHRLTSLQVHGQDVKDSDTFSAALPISLADGGAGYFSIWNSRDAAHIGVTMLAAIEADVKAAGTISPDPAGRLVAQ